MRSQLCTQSDAQAVEPFHFVGKLFTARCLTVDEVAVDHTYLTIGCVQRSGDHAGLLIGKPGDVFDHITRGRAAQNRDPVVRFLTKYRTKVTRIFKRLKRILVIAEFEFLQAQRINGIGCQPVENLRQTYRQRVYIPG